MCIHDKDVYVTPVEETGKRRGTCSFYWRIFSILYQAWKGVRAKNPDMATMTGASMAHLKNCERHGGRFTITGFKSVPREGRPYVFVANHMGTLETLIFPALLAPFSPLCIVVKAGLMKIPFWGTIMKAWTNPIVVEQTSPVEDLKKVMEMGTKALQEGKSVLIFPEGGRYTTFDPLLFSSIGVKLAGRTGSLCVPVALKTDFLQRGKIISYFGRIDPSQKIRFACGRPVKPEGSGKAQQRECLNFIIEHLKAWGIPIEVGVNRR